MLLDRARTAGEIVENFDMARPSVSGHVRALVACELVTEQGRGRSILYSIAPAPLLEVGAWLSPFGRCWRNHLAGLRSVLDDMERMAQPRDFSLDRDAGQLDEPAE